jgi:adenosine deaminase CECR1
MPKGALLHSHSGGIANTDWLINKASEYENCYIFINQDQQKYIYGQLMIFEKEEIPIGFIKLNDFLKSNANAKEKLRDLYTLKRNNLSEYIDYWSEFEKNFYPTLIVMTDDTFLKTGPILISIFRCNYIMQI